MIRILFAEDEAILGGLVKEALENEQDFDVDWVDNGEAAILQFKTTNPDLCVLDVMMPVMDGFTVAKEIRKINSDVPILFLTARSQTADVLKGFESGGNDYLKKPFSVAELTVRVRELLRRNAPNKRIETGNDLQSYQLGIYEYFPDTQVLRCEYAQYNLTHRENELFREFVIKKNHLVDRKDVLMRLWGDDSFFHARNMDVYIAKLRKYLVHDPSLSIINVRGYGFKLIENR